MLRVKKIDGIDCLHFKTALLATNGGDRQDAQQRYDESEIVVYDNGYGDKDEVLEECERFYGMQPAVAGNKRSREDCEELELTCKVLETLAKTHKLVDDESLQRRILTQMCNQQRRIERLCNSDPEDADAPVYASSRVLQLLPDADISDEQLYEIGKLASRYYYAKYRMHPLKVPRYIGGRSVLVNKYTAKTAPHTLDVAIRDVLELED